MFPSYCPLPKVVILSATFIIKHFFNVMFKYVVNILSIRLFVYFKKETTYNIGKLSLLQTM